jgi:hypothetical protein
MESLNNESRHSTEITPQRKIIVNPYLIKKKAPFTPAAPSVARPFIETNPQYILSNSSMTTEKMPEEASRTLDAPKSNSGLILNEDHTSVIGNLPPAKRLPSNNVTFQSSEILTVSELHASAMDYKDQSIRVTGVVLHRYVYQADGSVCFVLGDPLLAPKPRTSRRPSSVSFSKSGRQQHPAPSVHPSTPSQPRAPLFTGQSALLLGDRTPRRLVHVSKSTSTPRLLGQKRPRLAVSPVATMVTTLLNQRALLVIANPIHVHVRECGLGDLVMVIGQVQVHSANHDAPAKELLEGWKEKRNQGAGTELTYVQPRILRNVNGTDMRLQFETLKLRRKHLLAIRGEFGVIAGCGPTFSTTSRATA